MCGRILLNVAAVILLVIGSGRLRDGVAAAEAEADDASSEKCVGDLDEAHKMIGRLQLKVERYEGHLEGLTNAAIDDRRHLAGVVWERDACKQEVDSLKAQIQSLVRENAVTTEVSQRRIAELTELNRALSPRHETSVTTPALASTNASTPTTITTTPKSH